MSFVYKLGVNAAEVEDFGEALLCGGRVCLCEKLEYGVDESPGWSPCESVLVHAGSYVRTGGRKEIPVLLEHDEIYSIVQIGAELDVIHFDEETGRITDFTRHVGISMEQEAAHYSPSGIRFDFLGLRFNTISDFHWHEEDGEAVIDRVKNVSKNVLVPDTLGGLPVRAVNFRDLDLLECRVLIVSEGIKSFGASFRKANRLRRFELPSDIEITHVPDMLGSTPWFRKQRVGKPIYFGNWYCGTPGGGAGGRNELRLREGTLGVAGGADSSCYWTRIELPDSVLEVGEYAFSYSLCLEDVQLSQNLKILGRCAFHKCPRLRSLELPDSLLPRATWAFTYCRALESVSIGWRAWDGEDSHFTSCPLIIIRRENETDYVHRDTTPKPVTGTLTAFLKNRSFTAAGKRYGNLKQLTVEATNKLDYLDKYGRTVRYARARDPRYSGEFFDFWEERWYIKTNEGITQIEVIPLDYCTVVTEGVRSDEVPQLLWEQVKDLFEEVVGNEN